MSNALNTVTANRNLVSPDPSSSFLYDTAGRKKPLKDKAELLPSRIIGSPIEYAGDTIKDAVNIARAAKGNANDHELGRINDLALKLGSLGIAGYLYVKNPFKLTKSMEFAGFGAFFASMALWPKLAIQLPLKLRTGVDFMQKYKDSQGRKKMLYQDPQYVLTDLLPRSDLNKIGKKLKVSEDLPDRDNFIKQRAHKTALQANTLWMITAGFASPVMSALACNLGEKFLKPWLQKRELIQTEREYLSSAYQTEAVKAAQKSKLDALERFMKHNSDKPLREVIPEIAANMNVMLEEANAVQLKEPLLEALNSLTMREVNEDLVKSVFGEEALNAVKKAYGEDIIKTYIKDYKDNPAEAAKNIANLFAQAQNSAFLSGAEAEAKMLSAVTGMKTGEASSRLKQVYEAFSEFAREKKTADKYIDARIGDRAFSFIANHWEKTGNRFLRALNIENFFTTGSLKVLSQGNEASLKLLQERMEVLSSSSADYNKFLTDLMNLTKEYEKEIDDKMIHHIGLLSSKELKSGRTNRVHVMFNDLKHEMQECGLLPLSKKIAGNGMPWSSPAAAGTFHKTFVDQANDRILGAKNSFYRIIHALDIFRLTRKRKDNSSILSERIKFLLQQQELDTSNDNIQRMIQICKDVLLKAEPADYIEKFSTKGFNLNEKEYQVVMQTLYSSDTPTILKDFVEEQTGEFKDTAFQIFEGYKKYKKEAAGELINSPHNMRPDLVRRVIGSFTGTRNGVRKNDLPGAPLLDYIAGAAKTRYNSKKWLMLFGWTMAGLTAATLAAGYMLGRKGNMEKQAEEESRMKHNG